MPPPGNRYINLSPTEEDESGDGLSDPAPTGVNNLRGQQDAQGLSRLPAVTPRTPAPGGVSFPQFQNRLHTKLPGDSEGRGCFDTRATFVAGDPGAKFGTNAPLEYETTGEVGHPHWEAIFEYILRECSYLLQFSTVYVMVDDRDLADHTRQDATLPHWPAAARWWHSRLKLIGPHREKTELLLFPNSEETGLHKVHPTWAGTFVLAALVAAFPGINFVLLDSDCLPVTLFEIEDLWTEAYLARYPAHLDTGLPQEHPLHACPRFKSDPKVLYTQQRVNSTRMGQGVLLVTEPHSELNAGMVVVFRSSHPPLFDWDTWALRYRGYPLNISDEEYREVAAKLTDAFWERMGEFLLRSCNPRELSMEEKALWIQSGLALSPLMGTYLQYSLDFCLSWALIGEWTSRVLFPVPTGRWPRHGHAGALLRQYQSRSPRIVAWARAAFEQGALPALLLMPGIAPVFSLPGDRMFQAQGILQGCQRPVIIHAYGGAKANMENALAAIAVEGWLPMAAAMLGTEDKPPMWATVGLRPVVGTTVDLKVQPAPLSEREMLLLLTCWQRWDKAGVQGSALSKWLLGVDVTQGPDGYDSPTFLQQPLGDLEAGQLYQQAQLSPLEEVCEENSPCGKEIGQLVTRIFTYEYPLVSLQTLYFLAATGHLPSSFPAEQWTNAVRWHGDSKVVAVCKTIEEWEDAQKLLAPLENTVVEAESAHGMVVWTSSLKDQTAISRDSLPLTLVVKPEQDLKRHLPATVHVETTGLGGRDLTYPIPWNISIRTDKEGQSVYGPSLAPLEEKVVVCGDYGRPETRHITALGKSKAAHEFVVLHYFALDSAKLWDEVLEHVLPTVGLPGAEARRATALEVFGGSHIQPSHRRMPHVLWTDSMTLVWALLLGGRMGRYTGSPDTIILDQRVEVRGFSAGSFAGLSLLQLLWKIPNVASSSKLGAIACPPQLLTTPPAPHTLHLFHYEADQLCVWKPSCHQLEQLKITYTYVNTQDSIYSERFGTTDHNYSHWLALQLPAGWWDIARFLFLLPDAASGAKRDATPLRLLSWLSFQLDPAVEALIEETMGYLSTTEKATDAALLELGTKHLGNGTPFESVGGLRDRLIELVSVGNLKHRPEALFALFRQFLQRLTLPRLCHFLDLVLPQLTPVQAPWVDATRTLWNCHHIRARTHQMRSPYRPRVAISYFFTAHDNIHHVRVHWGTLPLLLFSDPRVVAPDDVNQFQGQAAHRLNQQHIQLGLRRGMSVLLYYRVKGEAYENQVFQAVLIAHESVTTRATRTENKLWKRVVPSVTEFAWLSPNIAWAFCADALRRRGDCQYLSFSEPHMGLTGRAFQADILIEDISFLGDTRSADELSVFTNMAPERLCLGCGLRVDEKFTPIFPGERGRLFMASVQLLQFALRADSALAGGNDLTEEEEALALAILPLMRNSDCHFLATLTSLLQSVLEGKTDCPISGVFGAGKTRAAAAMIGGLLVMDPTLKVMVITKENAAAHAFTKHFESLMLPPSINDKVGRLVGATELQKGPASKTNLDVPPKFRNDVLRSKQVIIGCGGGFHQECSQPYSPVAKWMEDVDVALNDEGQQYGNLDETSAIARVPRKGLVIWCGDHKQTPGGLRKTDEAKAFRRKLMRRPIALRGDTNFIQPHMLGAIVLPYVQGVTGPQGEGLRQLLQESTQQPLKLSPTSISALQELCQETIGRCWEAEVTPCLCAAISVLWLALSPEKFPLQASTFGSAAGTAGKQKWALILPSSARVSELTYVTIVGARYPELDTYHNDIIQFGNYLQGEQCTRGGFLPIFWDAPESYMHASTDIGEVVEWIRHKFPLSNEENKNLAVLHNRNKMVNAFATTEWVAGSAGAVLSRSVTSCAGMTAYLVLLAQTKVGFLSGGRGKGFQQLTPQEQDAQKEEAYARATVALTRAKQICLIMGPLDMRGLVGAATVIGCLKYGACFSGFDADGEPLVLLQLKDDDLLEAPDDSAFLQSLRISCSRVNGVYPPLSMAEAFLVNDDPTPRVRRLHLIIVDLKRRGRLANQVRRRLARMNVVGYANRCWNALPIRYKQDQPTYHLRYVFAYAMDGTDLPCYILWPARTDENSFWCLDAWKGDWVELDRCNFLAPVGIEHFFDAFSLNPGRPWRTAAGQALGIQTDHIAEDNSIDPSEGSKFTLTPRCIPTERKVITEKSGADVPMHTGEESGSGEESGWSWISDSSSTDSDGTISDASSVVSDQDRFDTAYAAFRDLSDGLYDIDTRQYSRGVTSDDVPGILLQDGQEKLQDLVHLPRNWPLARLTIPLGGLSKQVDRLLEGYCFQILATNQNPHLHHGRVIQMAKHLTLILAEYLADTIAWLMRSILGHESKILFDTDTEPLMTPGFWILPLYRELLNSASRNRPSAASERARGSTGLVKIICKENKAQRTKRKYHDGTPHPKDMGGFAQWFGSCSLINTLYVWFPASWAPMVAATLFAKSFGQGQPARGLTQLPDRGHNWHPQAYEAAGSSGPAEGAATDEVMYKIRKGPLNGAEIMPMLNVTSRVSWLELDDGYLLKSYDVLREGILADVFAQKCSAAWQGAPGQRLTVSILLPGRQNPDEWLDLMLSQKNLWPTFTLKGSSTDTVTEKAFRKERRRLRAKHLWPEVKVNWDMLYNRMYTDAPTGMSASQLEYLLFNRAARSSITNPYQESAYRGPRYKDIQEKWEQKQKWMLYYRRHREPLVIDIGGIVQTFQCKEMTARSEIDSYMDYCAKRWQTREGTYQIKRRKLLPDVRDPPEQEGEEVDKMDI